MDILSAPEAMVAIPNWGSAGRPVPDMVLIANARGSIVLFDGRLSTAL